MPYESIGFVFSTRSPDRVGCCDRHVVSGQIGCFNGTSFILLRPRDSRQAHAYFKMQFSESLQDSFLEINHHLNYTTNSKGQHEEG